VIATLSKRRQRNLKTLIGTLAASPLLPSDYAVRDESGRTIEHLMSEDFVFSYWVDHGAKEVRITEIEILD
jgi:hypothetical protein